MSSPSPTARLLREAIDASPLTQREIAARAGFSRPNVLSMMKRGEMKVPLDRIPALARILNVEPARFLGCALVEYDQDVYEALQEALGLPLEEDEIKLVGLYRQANANGNLILSGPLLEGVISLFELARQAADY